MTEPLNQYHLHNLLKLLKQNTFYLNGKPVTLTEEGYDAYGMFHIKLETERDDVMLGFPVKKKVYVDIDLPMMDEESDW